MYKKLIRLSCLFLFFFCIMPEQGVAGIDPNSIPRTNFTRFDEDLDLSEQTTDISGNGWQWKASEKQLYLKGTTIAISGSTQIIWPENTEIILAEGTDNYLVCDGRYGFVESEGNIKINGNGRLTICSNQDGMIIEGDCIIESGQIRIDAEDTGISATNYIQNGGVISIKSESEGILAGNYIQNGGELSIKSASDGILADKVVMNNGQLNIDTHEDGIFTDNMEFNNGLMEIKAGFAGIFTHEGKCVINDGILKIGQASGCADLLWGISVFDQAQLHIHGGDVQIYGKEEAIGGAIRADEAIDKKVIIDGGHLELTGTAAMAIYTQLDLTSKVNEQTIPALDNIIQIDPAVKGAEHLEMQRVKKVLNYNDEDYVQYVYGFYQDGELASNVMLTSEQESSPSRLDGFYVNGKKITLTTANDGSVYIDENGRTIVPLRTITEAMGCTAKWDNTDQSITITDGKDVTAVFYLNQKTYWVNGEERQMDTTAVSLPPGRTHVPLRFVAESLGAQVEMTSDADGRPQIQITTRK